MKPVSVILCMFIPNFTHLVRFKNALYSLLSFSLLIEKVYINGWVVEELWADVLEFIHPLPLYIDICKLETNSGKSNVINDFSRIVKTKYVLVIDSDIILSYSTLSLLLYYLARFYVVIPWQYEDTRHNEWVLDDCFNSDYNVYIPRTEIGIGGGCFLTLTSILIDIPFIDKGPYGSDDVEWLESVLNKYPNRVCITRLVSVIHPFLYDINYSNWKQNMSISSYHVKLSDKSIDKRIKESEKLWIKN